MNTNSFSRLPEIVAHRGASRDAPENTLRAFALGYTQGADGVELDIHLSRDGTIVVIHDDNTARVAGADLSIDAQTLDALRAINIANWGPWQGRNLRETIPTLDEALALVPTDRRLFIEIKSGQEILPALDATLRRASTRAEQTVIMAFSPEVASASKRRFPDRQTLWLVEFSNQAATPAYSALDQLIEKARRLGVDGLSLDHRFRLDAMGVQRAHEAGLALYVWTVDDPIEARAFANAGIDGITTNCPGALRREMAACE